MVFRYSLQRACRAAPSAARHVPAYRTVATKTTPPRLYEYVVIINDLPTATRQTREPSIVPALRNLSFMGNIMGDTSSDIRGEVLACKAASKEEIETHLRSHPSAKNVWDMETISIWPLDTVHSTALEASGDAKTAARVAT